MMKIKLYLEGGMYEGIDTGGTSGVAAGAEAEPHEAERAMPTAALRIDTILTIFIVYLFSSYPTRNWFPVDLLLYLYTEIRSASNNQIFLGILKNTEDCGIAVSNMVMSLVIVAIWKSCIMILILSEKKTT